MIGATELLSGHADYAAAGHAAHPGARLLGPYFVLLALASVTACAIARAVFGDRPFLVLEAMRVGQAGQYLLFAALGVLAGTVGIGFMRFLYAAEDLCDRLWRGPQWLRPAVGGLLAGTAPDVRSRLPRP
ncbi:chloride channel protein [Streptomyces sp. AP-93]|uniref:chloride channel protein n=1 Tax=Streptomyces sp. AP-93 TaxID=2929048 RepID=UPI0035B05A07